MEGLLEWIKAILYFCVFAAFFLQLLPNDSYRKYIRFFIGLLLILLVLEPLFGADGTMDVVQKRIESIFEEEQEKESMDLDEMEKEVQQFYQEQLETALQTEMMLPYGGSDGEGSSR